MPNSHLNLSCKQTAARHTAEAISKHRHGFTILCDIAELGKDNKEAWFLKLNPLGKVPTVVCGDDVVRVMGLREGGWCLMPTSSSLGAGKVWRCKLALEFDQQVWIYQLLSSQDW